MGRFWTLRNRTNSVSMTHKFEIDDLADGAVRDKLKWAISDLEQLKPGEPRQTLTECAARHFRTEERRRWPGTA